MASRFIIATEVEVVKNLWILPATFDSNQFPSSFLLLFLFILFGEKLDFGKFNY